MTHIRRLFALGAVLALSVLITAPLARAQGTPLEITVAGAEFEPMPIAIQPFQSADPSLTSVAADIVQVISDDLERSGLFRIVPREAHVSRAVPFDSMPAFADWRVINADALVTGLLARAEDGRLRVQFRVFDTQGEEQVEGLQLLSAPEDWRRVAHKVADGIYSRLTGEGPYFDSRVVFVDETGPKGDRRKRIAIMDQDGANLRYLPAEGLVLTPRFAPSDRAILYISYDTGEPQVYLMSLDGGQRERLGNFPGMTFAPRFSPDGSQVVLSLAQDGNTDIYAMTLAGRQMRRLTSHPGIDTGPSFSPDGTQIVFESDRGGSQQLYIMSNAGGEPRRISFGRGSYGTPVWSPRGDLIAFTKILGGRFHIGVMRTDGSDERLLTSSFLDEGPTWSPNGRVLMFFRESPGQSGSAQMMSIDITGRNLRVVPTPNAASDPAWSPLRR
ncbi:Tol-Pal system protein TolB [Limibaculum sp. M0105]|uniref:Tol-Pal system protein TolB n=1 Tax=Thermohalobaculum xanthum TaxID=2753746 RepID=A0A8J7M6F7_9RHOB|nr:Tol-Pal system beta propeller repeat protein TolB [Thermohalobaculum xanthum]MBK0399349.1 Tol-Pal system protein TolB [Thermohalobaculum xanthum]